MAAPLRQAFLPEHGLKKQTLSRDCLVAIKLQHGGRLEADPAQGEARWGYSVLEERFL